MRTDAALRAQRHNQLRELLRTIGTHPGVESLCACEELQLSCSLAEDELHALRLTTQEVML